MEITAAIISAFFGGVLASLTGVGLYFFQKWQDKKNLKKLFLTAIKDDLAHSIPLYEKIKSVGKTSKNVPFEITVGLRKSRKIYDKYTENLLSVEPYSFRKRIFDYYLQSEALIDKLELYQKRIYDIKNKHEEISSRIKENPMNLTEEEINNKIAKLTEKETNELEWLNSEILEQLNNLDTIKIEAQLIWEKLA